MTYRKYTPQEAKERAEAKRSEVQATMKAGVQALLNEIKQGHSERLLACLNFSAQFHQYSPNNQFLIMLECFRREITPEYVAGFTTWKRLNYTVRKGEKGIPIFAPCPIKKEDAATGEEETIMLFKVVYVFADTQVEAMKEGMPPFPKFFTPLDGDCEQLVSRLTQVIQEDGIKIVERALGGPLGMSEKGRISIVPELESVNKFLVLIHEYAHELLHPKGVGETMTKTVKECQAEATAYVVAHHFGIHNPFSSDYLQMWGNDEKTLMAEIEAVQQAAAVIIKKMEAPFMRDQPNDVAA